MPQFLTLYMSVLKKDRGPEFKSLAVGFYF